MKSKPAKESAVKLRIAKDIVADLHSAEPQYGAYDTSALNGASEVIQTLIKCRINDLTTFTSTLQRIEEENPALYKYLMTPKLNGILLSEVTPKKVRWLWQRRLPLGKLVMLDGDPGLGKTTVVFDLIARLTTGRNMPEDEGYAQSGGAVIISLEDGLEDTIQPRLAKAGADLSRISSLSEIACMTEDGKEYTRPFLLTQDLPALEEEIKRVNAKLVMIDPIMSVIGDKDTYKDNEVRAALAPLKSLAERCDVTVILIRHITKSGSDKLIYQGGGSIAFIGLARVGLMVMKNPDNEDQIILANPKNNLGRTAPKLLFRVVSEDGEDERPHIQWEGETTITDQELTRPTTQAPSATRQAILKALKENYPGALSPQAIVDLTGESLEKVNVTLGRMVKDDQIVKASRGMYSAHSGISSLS